MSYEQGGVSSCGDREAGGRAYSDIILKLNTS